MTNLMVNLWTAAQPYLFLSLENFCVTTQRETALSYRVLKRDDISIYVEKEATTKNISLLRISNFMVCVFYLNK